MAFFLPLNPNGVHLGCLIAFAALAVAAGLWDWRTRSVPNAIPAAIVLAYVAWAGSGLTVGSVQPRALGLTLLASAGLSGLAVLAFARGVLGGGDVKLLGASSLFAGVPLMEGFLAVTAIVGGLIGLAALASSGGVAATVATGRPQRSQRVAYAPAIAAGCLWVVVMLIGSS